MLIPSCFIFCSHHQALSPFDIQCFPVPQLPPKLPLCTRTWRMRWVGRASAGAENSLLQHLWASLATLVKVSEPHQFPPCRNIELRFSRPVFYATKDQSGLKLQREPGGAISQAREHQMSSSPRVLQLHSFSGTHQAVLLTTAPRESRNVNWGCNASVRGGKNSIR